MAPSGLPGGMARSWRRTRAAEALLLLSAAAAAAVARADAEADAGPVRLLRGFPGAAAAGLGWREEGRAAEDEEVELTFAMKLRNTRELERLLERVSDPNSPEYGHYLTKEQADALTAPKAEDVDVVKRFLHGIAFKEHGGGSFITARVPIRVAEELFGGAFVRYCHANANGSKEQSCVLRNLAARVPEDVHRVCGAISPLDDPLPPIFQGPIIRGEGSEEAPVHLIA